MGELLSDKKISIKNIKLDAFEFTIERSKVKEFVLALGEENPIYLNGDKLPITFPTIMDFWGGAKSAAELLQLDPKKVLHGEQHYEYFEELQVGDTLIVNGLIEAVVEKENMTLYKIKKTYVNQYDQLVLIAHSTIVERK